MTSGDAGDWRGLSYTALEDVIVGLHQAQADAIRARFRKLRLRPFPDDIRAGPGKRVPYDLPRVLALLAVFELNALLIPQGHAAALVEATWPEWCRAAIVAAADLGIVDRPPNMPSWSSSAITILPDAFSGNPSAVAAYAAKPDKRLITGGAPAIGVDVARLISALQAATSAQPIGTLANSFRALEATFGWTRPTFPSRSELAEVARGRGFLEEGPFIGRARTLLGIQLDDKGMVPTKNVGRMQAIADYLDEPAPVDAWKAITGRDEGSLRLGHLLQAWAVKIGLKPREQFPNTILDSDDVDPLQAARDLLDAIGETANAN